MPSAKPAKKTGTIEIRISDEVKAAFMARCRRDDLTASEAIRRFIDTQLAPRPDVRQRRASHLRLAVAAIVGAALGVGVAAPSFARSAQKARPAFDQLDRNHDGVLNYQEYRSL